MLCDEFLPTIERLKRTGAPSWQVSDMSELCAAISEAEKFVFDESAACAAANIANSRFSTQLEALQFARVPYRRTWIEVAAAHLKPMRSDEDNGKPLPNRIGYLIESEDDFLSGQIVIAWNHRTSGLTVCPFGVVFDHGEVNQLGKLSIVASGASPFSKYSDSEILKRFPALSCGHQPLREVAAARVLEDRCGLIAAAYHEGFWTHDGHHREQIAPFSEDALAEARVVRSMLIMVQCRNAVEIKKVDQTKLNKAREKGGKSPLYDFSQVTLNPSLKRQCGARILGVSERELRQHLVRGHFKVRKTGVFFWSPHLRGNASLGIKEKSYLVAGGDE